MDELSCDDVSCFCKDSGELHIVLDVGDSRSVADSRGNGLRQLDSGWGRVQAREREQVRELEQPVVRFA